MGAVGMIMTMKEKIEKFLEYLPTITQEEADLILEIINWDDETKVAFKFAKSMFEEKEEK